MHMAMWLKMVVTGEYILNQPVEYTGMPFIIVLAMPTCIAARFHPKLSCNVSAQRGYEVMHDEAGFPTLRPLDTAEPAPAAISGWDDHSSHIPDGLVQCMRVHGFSLMHYNFCHNSLLLSIPCLPIMP